MKQHVPFLILLINLVALCFNGWFFLAASPPSNVNPSQLTIDFFVFAAITNALFSGVSYYLYNRQGDRLLTISSRSFFLIQFVILMTFYTCLFLYFYVL